MRSRVRLNRNGIVYTVALNHWLPRRILRHDAVTFNGVIRCADSVMTADLHCHEFQHVRQEHEMGRLKFWLAYLWELRHGYRKNRFEAEAYAIQADPAQVATFFAVGT